MKALRLLKTYPAIAVMIGVVLGVLLSRVVIDDVGESHKHADDHKKEGPNGGRLLEDGALSIEVKIFEEGIPPELRAFVFDRGKPVDPASVTLKVELHRFGGQVDAVSFAKREDYLVGDIEIVEPHSFDVKVSALSEGKTSTWEYESYEGRTSMTEDAARRSGVEIETVGPANLRATISVSGRVRANEDKLVHVIPRYPGIVKRAAMRLGDRVQKGAMMAVVESNQSLQPYSVRAPLSGTVIYKHTSNGEYAKEGETIYTVADLSSVWVDFDVYRQDFAALAIGQAIQIFAGDHEQKAEGKIAYLSPFGAEGTQTTLARVELPNTDGEWRPGIFVTGDITVNSAEVPIAVRTSSLQTFRDWDVVYKQHGEIYEIAIIELGRRDGEWVEVLSGLKSGQKYVTANSFILKADVGKSGASHDH